MWLPCNFGERVIARVFHTQKYEDYYFIGITRGCFNKYDYIFTRSMENPRLDLQLEDKDKISYMPYDIHNETFIKQDTLNPVDIKLKLSINDSCVYKDYFDTKSSKLGTLKTIILKENGLFHYVFLEKNGTPATFIVDKLLIKEMDLKENQEGQISFY